MIASASSSGQNPVPLKISLKGLLAAESALLVQFLQESFGVPAIQDQGYNVLVVDTRHPEATRILRERSVGAVIVIVLGPSDREIPGTLTLRRPMSGHSVANVFQDVRVIATKRAQAGVTPSSMRGTTTPPSTSMGPGSLQELASSYRFNLVRKELVKLSIGGSEFQLYPQRYLYRSAIQPQELSQFRGRDGLRIEVESTDPGNNTKLAPEPGTGRRLDEFLWHLGFNAGDGRLLPWLTAERAYKLTRWPPVVRTGGDSRMVKLGSVLAHRALRTAELCKAGNMGESLVSDFLNGCSLVGCIEASTEAHPSRKVVVKANPSLLPLLGRIRLKFGLT